MSKETAKNLFIVSSMPRLYQHLLSGIAGYEALGNRIVKQIKAAHAFRRVEQVRELATILCNMPIKEYQLIGQYYLVWCSCRESVYKAEALENLIGQTRTYKAQILLSRAGIEVYQDNLEAASYFYTEALRTSPAISEYISAMLGIAAIKGIEGFHQSALKDMHGLIPIIEHAEPRLFFNVLNSYATELGAVGRLDEARNVSRLVLASPFAFAYPEWRETAEQVQGKSRSFVAVNPSRSGNVLRFWPQDLPSEPVTEKAKILSLAERLEQKRKAIKRKAEKAFKIRTKILSDDLPEDVVDTIMRILGITYYD